MKRDSKSSSFTGGQRDAGDYMVVVRGMNVMILLAIRSNHSTNSQIFEWYRSTFGRSRPPLMLFAARIVKKAF
jgi:hypothetical protein